MTDNLPQPSLLVIIPPPVWALIFVLAAYLGGWLAGADTLFRQPVLGWTVFLIGFAVSASGRLAFAKAKTEVVPASAKNSNLVTFGPYKMTRNPMYLGILIAVAGLAIVIGTVFSYGAIVLFFLFANFISIPYEEEKMEKQFGDAYRAYKSRVRRWI